MKILYSSKEVLVALKKLLSEPDPDDERVALVAYVGAKAEAYLPSPKNLRVICSLTPGATSPFVIRSLRERGALVESSPRLHMKVYSSKKRGSVITSANASANALGVGGLKEVGVLLPPGALKVEQLIRYAHPQPISNAALKKLQTATKNLPRHLRLASDRPSDDPRFDFLRWFHSDARQTDPWKLWGWQSSGLQTAGAAKEKSKVEFGVTEPVECMNVGRTGVERSDWVLCFELRDAHVRDFGWMYIDFVVLVKPSERGAYEREYPRQAIQVYRTSLYNRPPFHLTPRFRKAFKRAAVQYGLKRLESTSSSRPPAALLRLVAKLMSAG